MGQRRDQVKRDSRWHLDCLNAYRIASDQHPEEIKHTFCEMCGERADEIDHHLATLRAFTPDNLRWQCLSCHQHKTRRDRKLVRFAKGCSLD